MELRAETSIFDDKLLKEDVDNAQETADNAQAIAGTTAQYFWFLEEIGSVPAGVGTGAHITNLTKEEFLYNPANGGGNLLARSNGIAIRDGLTELATFSEEGVNINRNGASIASFGAEETIINASDGSRVVISPTSLDLQDAYHASVFKAFVETNGVVQSAKIRIDNGGGEPLYISANELNFYDGAVIRDGGDKLIIYAPTIYSPNVAPVCTFEDNGVFNIDGTLPKFTVNGVPIYQSGHITYSSIATNSYADKTVTFSPTFNTAPNVVACLSTSGTAGNIGNVSVSVFNISKTGCTIRVFNNRGSALSPAVEWIAVGMSH